MRAVLCVLAAALVACATQPTWWLGVANLYLIPAGILLSNLAGIVPDDFYLNTITWSAFLLRT